jgi:UDP-arabinose 4-epimerase
MDTVLVTGGAGYIGSHACKALAGAGLRPVTYDNLSAGNRFAVRWGPLEIGDLLDAERLREIIRAYQPIAIMHFAASALVGESMAAPSLYYRNNVVGSVNLLEAAREHGITRLVLSSTCATYGMPEKIPIPVDAPQEPINPYGRSKLMVERVLFDYDRAYGLKSAILRYFNAAGADPEGEIGEARAIETHLVPLALDAALRVRPPLKIYGIDYPTPDGTAIRDYIHVTDLAEAHVAALELLMDTEASFVVNLGTGRGFSVNHVIASVERVTNRHVPRELAPRRPGDPPELIADPKSSQVLLGLSFRRSELKTIIDTAWRWRIGFRGDQCAGLDLERSRASSRRRVAAMDAGPLGAVK